MCRILILGSGSEATLSNDYQTLVKQKKAEPRSSPAVLLIHDDTKILFDCGPDIKEQLRKARARPDLLFVTHAHPDHIDGIDDIPESTRKYLKEGAEFDHCKVIAFPIIHSVIAPAVGYKFFSDHLRIIYCPDFLRIEEEERVLPDTDLAILDGSSLKRDIIRGPQKNIGHQSMLNSIEMCRRYGIKNIIFLHIGTHGKNHEWLAKYIANQAREGETFIVAKDGMEFELTAKGLATLEESNYGWTWTCEVPPEIQTKSMEGIETEISWLASSETGTASPTTNTFSSSTGDRGRGDSTTSVYEATTSIPTPITEIESPETASAGLYLKSPHGQRIADKQKTLIVKTIKFTKHIRVPIYILSVEDENEPGEAMVWAKVVLSEPQEISVDEFWKRKDEHTISREEFDDWGWKGKPLYAYYFQLLEVYKPPLKAKYPAGVQNWIEDVQFIGKAPKELKAELRETIYLDIQNKYERWKELNADHRYIHIWYARGRKTIRTDGGEEDIIKAHAMVVDALRSISFPMEPQKGENKNAELDRLSRKYEKTNPPESDEERKEWDQKRRELFEKGKLKRRPISADIEEARLPEDFIRSIEPAMLEEMEDDALYELHSDLHSSYDPDEMIPEFLLNAHIFVVEEMRARDLEIPEFGDELDQETERLMAPTLAEDLAEVVSKLVPFVVTEAALCITGSHAYGLKKEPEDLDFLLRRSFDEKYFWQVLQSLFPEKAVHVTPEPKGPNWDFIPVGDLYLIPTRRSLEIQEAEKEITFEEDVPEIAREVCRRLKPFIVKTNFLWYSPPLAFYRDDPEPDAGFNLKLMRLFPNAMISEHPLIDGAVPVADLWFIPRSHFRKVRMIEPEFKPYYGAKEGEYGKLIEERKAPPITKPITKIELGEWFPPIKAGAFGYAGKEVFTIDEAWEFWGSRMLERGETILAEQKFDGTRLQIHVDKEKQKVWIFTEGALEKKQKGIDVSEKMPDVVEDALKNLKCGKNCIIDSETVKWEEGLPQRREEMAAILVGKEPVRGVDIRVNCFDLVWLDDEDLSQKGYLERKEVLKSKVLPKDTKHFYFVPHIIVKSKKEFYAAYEKLSKIIGSEGVMWKTGGWKYSLRGRIPWMAKTKVLFEIDVMIIGRRKVPAPKPPKKRMTAEAMMKLLPSLLEKSKTWTFRCAFLGKDGKLQPLYSDKTYAPGDLTLKWDEERQKWKGLEDPKYWEMMKGFPNSELGAQCYGNTYNFKAPEGIEPKIGDIITVAPVLIRLWKDEKGKIQASWVFPRPRNLKPERKEPDDWRVVNAIVSAVARRHGVKPKFLIEEFEEESEIYPLVDLEEMFPAFTSQMGKFYMRDKLLKLIPPHDTYVEPFAGAASLFWAKERSAEEVLNDKDPEIAFAYRFLRDMTDQQIEALRHKNWICSKNRFEMLKRSRPLSDTDRFYRFLYLTRSSWNGNRINYAEPSTERKKRMIPKVIHRLSELRSRLKNVKIRCQDGVELIKEFDSPTTFFYIDPPYAAWYGLEKFPQMVGKLAKELHFKEDDWRRLERTLRRIKGKFLLSAANNKFTHDLFRGFNIRTVTTRKTPGGIILPSGHWSTRMGTRREVLISNYDLKEEYLFEAEEEGPLTHEEQRELAEKIFGNPYMIEQPFQKPKRFALQHHLRGIWFEAEREGLLNKIKACKSQDELNKLWKEKDCEYLIDSYGNLEKALRKVDEARGDVHKELSKFLSKDPPNIEELDTKRVFNRGNAHTDLRMEHPTKNWLVGWTIVDPRLVLQNLETGELFFPLRDKVLENQPLDKSPATRKATQPKVWLTLVTPEKPIFEAKPGEVGATLETSGRIIYKTRGRVAIGTCKDDYFEPWLWFEKPYEELSGRWGSQKLAGRYEYEKVPAEWWMFNKVRESPGLYILYHDREEKEKQAQAEGLKEIIWNPDTLLILADDEVGREHLKQFFEGKPRLPEIKEVPFISKTADRVLSKLKDFDFTDVQINFLKAKYAEYSARGGKWRPK